MTTTHTLLGAALLVGLVCAIGGFLVGWIAHRDDTRRYHASRRDHLAHLDHLERLAQLERATTGCDVPREVVYVPIPMPIPMPMPGLGRGVGWAPAVTGRQIVDGPPALAPGWIEGQDR